MRWYFCTLPSDWDARYLPTLSDFVGSAARNARESYASIAYGRSCGLRGMMMEEKMCNSGIGARQIHPASEQELVVRSRTVSAQFRRPDLNRGYVVPVLSKALRIMRLLEMTEQPMSIPQICEATRVAHSTVYRILRTLSAHGYLPGGDHGVYAFRFVSQAETDREKSFGQKRTVGGATTAISKSGSCLMMADRELGPYGNFSATPPGIAASAKEGKTQKKVNETKRRHQSRLRTLPSTTRTVLGIVR